MMAAAALAGLGFDLPDSIFNFDSGIGQVDPGLGNYQLGAQPGMARSMHECPIPQGHREYRQAAPPGLFHPGFGEDFGVMGGGYDQTPAFEGSLFANGEAALAEGDGDRDDGEDGEDGEDVEDGEEAS